MWDFPGHRCGYIKAVVDARASLRDIRGAEPAIWELLVFGFAKSHELNCTRFANFSGPS